MHLRGLMEVLAHCGSSTCAPPSDSAQHLEQTAPSDVRAIHLCDHGTHTNKCASSVTHFIHQQDVLSLYRVGRVLLDLNIG
jgi:hypothetical protein